MNDEEVTRAFAALSTALEVDDPDLPLRFVRLERRDAVNAVVVTTLLVLGAAFVATGLGATSFVVLGARARRARPVGVRRQLLRVAATR